MGISSTGMSANNAAQLNTIARKNPLSGELFEQVGSPVIQVISDSTGNETSEWVYLLAGKLAAAYPTHNVKYALYSQPNSRYAAWTDVQSIGDDRYLQIVSGGTGNAFYVPDADITKTSADIDIRLHLALDDWQVGGNVYLFSKVGDTGHFCVALRLISNKVNIYWTEDGSTLKWKDSGIDTTTWTDGEAKWIRVTLDVDNGAGGRTVTGYTSTDGITWTGLDPQITATVTSVHVDVAANYNVGCTYAGAGKAPGKYFEVQYKDGIDGIELFPQPIESFRPPVDATTMTVFGGTPTIYIYNASVSGSGMTQWNAEAYVNAAVQKTFGANLFISLGHNDSNEIDAAYIAKWDAFIGYVNAKAISANKFFLTQNPITLPVKYINIRSARRKVLMSWAASKNMSVIDTYQAFNRDSRGVAALLGADGFHPNSAGQAVMVNKVWSDLAL